MTLRLPKPTCQVTDQPDLYESRDKFLRNWYQGEFERVALSDLNILLLPHFLQGRITEGKSDVSEMFNRVLKR